MHKDSWTAVMNVSRITNMASGPTDNGYIYRPTHIDIILCKQPASSITRIEAPCDCSD